MDPVTATSHKPPANEPVLVREDCDAVCTPTLDRPADYNALSEPLIDALQAAFDSVRGDSSIRVVVIAVRGAVFFPFGRERGLCAPNCYSS